MPDNRFDDIDDDFEKICFICHRPEGKSGRQVVMPGGISLCADCMQRTFNAMDNSGFSGLNMDGMDLGAMFGFPNDMFGNDNKNSNSAENKSESNNTDELTKDNSGDDNSDDTEKKKEDNNSGKTNNVPFSNVRFINLSDLQGEMFPGRQKLKKKKPGERKEPVIDLKNIPAPHKIKEQLDEFVVGQEQAKKVISVGVYNHYKRVASGKSDVEIEKSNMLMIGPTGSGKTYLVRTLAKLLDVPLAIADATSLTEAGYIGDDVESVVSKLLAAADNDVDKAETGIIFIDEIDKIAKKKNASTRDVSGESVQQGLLKLLEGSEVEVPVGANSKNAMVPLATINTRNILFICGGAFPDLEGVIKERLNEQSSIGFVADLKDKYDNISDIIRQVTIEDLRNYGMIPEFIGRLPIIFTLDELTKEMLARVLLEPKNAIIKQYQRLLEIDEVKLEFTEEAVMEIAQKAIDKKIGARALRSIIEEYMLDIMYEIPKDNNIGKVTITEEYIKGTGSPKISFRGIEE